MEARGVRAAALAGLAALALAACVPLVRSHGYVPPEADLARLRLGVDTRESVLAAVGRPTTEGVEGGRSLYYVQSRFRTLGALAPREVSREVLALTFAADGTLGAVERFGLADGRAVPLSRRTTDAIFADLGVVSRIFGNVGAPNAATILGETGPAAP